MTKRMLVALGVTLVLLGPTFAQTHVGMPSAPPIRTDELHPPVALGDGGPRAPHSLSCCAPGAGCAQPNDTFWVTGDYLLAFLYGIRPPNLVTVSEANTPRVLAGVVGAPQTNVVFGHYRVNNAVRSGFRISGGWNFLPELELSLEGGFRAIERDAVHFAVADQAMIIGRPYIDVTTDPRRAQAVLIAFPGVSAGGVQVQSGTGPFYDGWFDITQPMTGEGWLRLDGMVGYRYYRYGEALGVQQLVVPTTPTFAPGTQITSQDSFRTRNEFQGAEVGVRAQITYEDLSLNLLGKLAGGNLRKEVEIRGSQTVSVPGRLPVNNVGGVLALSSNIGTFVDNQWAIAPELGATVRWQVTDNLRLSLGYSAVFLERVVRAADQINVNINPNLFPPAVDPLPGEREPSFNMKHDDVWVQTINFGAEFVY